jgi:hypothetical protein
MRPLKGPRPKQLSVIVVVQACVNQKVHAFCGARGCCKVAITAAPYLAVKAHVTPLLTSAACLVCVICVLQLRTPKQIAQEAADAHTDVEGRHKIGKLQLFLNTCPARALATVSSHVICQDTFHNITPLQ